MKISKIFVPAAILFFSVVLILANKIIFKEDPPADKEYLYLSLFSEVTAQVKTGYVEEIDPTEKFPGAFAGMLASLDPFSSYLDTAKTKTYRAYRSGRYYDCGIFGAKIQNYFVITDVIPDSPAAQVELKPGDIIKAVNGQGLYALSFWEMYLSLLSSEPRHIQLTLFNKKNSREFKNVVMQTRLIDMHTSITPLPNDIILIKLTHFNNDAANLLKEKLEIYSKAQKHKPLKLIIDLRTYCNGDLDSFQKITRLFFKNKIALTLQQKDRSKEIFPDVKEKNTFAYKAVIIINSSTRYYGELLAAIFKNQGTGTMPEHKATLIGTLTQGFIAQSLQFPLPDHTSALVTYGLFQLNGKPTASRGIEPDIAVTAKDTDRIMEKCISILAANTAGQT